MKRRYTILLIIICLICFTGCGNKETISSNASDYKDTYTHEDLIVSSSYEKINDYLNTLFNELDFDGKMRLANSGEKDIYYTFAYKNERDDTVFTFCFDKEQEFVSVDISYAKYNDDSIDLVKEVIEYSRFNFNFTELASIRKILTASKATDNTEIGNYIISNLPKGNLTIKSKEKYNDNKDENNSNNDITKNKTNNNSEQNNANNNTNLNHQSNNNSNVQQNTQQQTQSENNTPSVSVSKQNALKRAQSYLRYSAFSRKRLIEQLEYENYSNEDATYAADNVGADWNAQALKKAQSYLNYSAFSRKRLIEQLEYEGFTSEQSNYGVNNVGADWNAQALKKAQSYLDYSAFSRKKLIEQLEYEGFTSEQSNYGVNNVGADWNAQASKKAQSYLGYSAFSHDQLVQQLEYEGFTHEQSEYGVAQNGL